MCVPNDKNKEVHTSGGGSPLLGKAAGTYDGAVRDCTPSDLYTHGLSCKAANNTDVHQSAAIERGVGAEVGAAGGLSGVDAHMTDLLLVESDPTSAGRIEPRDEFPLGEGIRSWSQFFAFDIGDPIVNVFPSLLQCKDNPPSDLSQVTPLRQYVRREARKVGA